MVRIAVIDNGVCEDKIKGNISHYKVADNAVVKEWERPADKLTHGTVCAYIIDNLMEQSETIYLGKREIGSFSVKVKYP